MEIFSLEWINSDNALTDHLIMLLSFVCVLFGIGFAYFFSFCLTLLSDSHANPSFKFSFNTNTHTSRKVCSCSKQSSLDNQGWGQTVQCTHIRINHTTIFTAHIHSHERRFIATHNVEGIQNMDFFLFVFFSPIAP